MPLWVECSFNNGAADTGIVIVSTAEGAMINFVQVNSKVLWSSSGGLRGMIASFLYLYTNADNRSLMRGRNDINHGPHCVRSTISNQIHLGGQIGRGTVPMEAP